MIDSSLFTDLMFYAVAFFMVVCAVATVTVKNILHSAIALIGTFFCTAVLFLLLHAEFLAIAQVLVYIGGVTIFVVFTILLTSQLGEQALLAPRMRRILAVLFSIVFFAIMAQMISSVPFPSTTHAPTESGYASMVEFGKRLLSAGPEGFIIPFEVISLLLLSALIGAITIARKPHEDRNPGEK